MSSQDRGAVVAAWWPWLLLPAVTTALVASGFVLAYVGGVRLDDSEAFVNPPLAVGFSVVAAGIWATRPEDVGVRRLAVLYTVVCIGAALVLPSYMWARVDRPDGSALVGSDVARWVSDWVWAFGAAPLIGLGVLLYPDGLLPGRRWSIFGALGLLAPPLLAIGAATGWSRVGGAGFLMLMTTATAGLVGLVVRYRRAAPRSDVRGQIGLFAAAAALIVVLASLPDVDLSVTVPLTLAVGLLLPGAVGSAVLRHRLLDPTPELAALSGRVRTLVSDREEERSRLRRELHDGLGPSLAAIALGLRRLEPTAGEQQPVVRELGDEVQRALAEVRRICEGLRPGELAELGLVAALEAASARLRVLGGPTITVTGAAPTTLPAAVEVAAFRLTMEAITNAVRHSSASTVEVLLALDDGLDVTVTDDGGGMRAGTEGVGVRAMHQRAGELGGWVRLEDEPGGGVRVHAWFPVTVRAPT